MRRLFLSFALLLPAVAAGQAVIQGGYSTQPLRDPVFDPARVIAESTALNNWLIVNHAGLSPERMAAPREHLYYLIDSRVKEIFAATGKTMPAGPDPLLADLFGWAERVGVYGGALLYNRFRSAQFEPRTPELPMPQGFSIELRDDLLHIDSAAGGWSVDVPYQFMVWKINDAKATNGQRMQIVVVSTGAAKDKGKLGRSQSTLMLIHAPDGNLNALMPFWEAQVGVKGSGEEKDLGWNKLRSRYRYDTQTQVHKELVGWRGPRGAFLVAYMGLDGAYQWNRPHFIDFLRAIKTKNKAEGLEP